MLTVSWKLLLVVQAQGKGQRQGPQTQGPWVLNM